jgi:hypothetical protein
MVTYEQELINMVNHCQPWSTTVNHGHGQPSSTIVKVIHSEIDMHAYMKTNDTDKPISIVKVIIFHISKLMTQISLYQPLL